MRTKVKARLIRMKWNRKLKEGFPKYELMDETNVEAFATSKRLYWRGYMFDRKTGNCLSKTFAIKLQLIELKV